MEPRERTPKRLFRRAAQERLSSPERLDELMRVTAPGHWLALGGLGLAVLAAILWGLFGTISVTVEGQGILLRGGALLDVTAASDGRVRSVRVAVGDRVAAGEAIAEIELLDAAAGEVETVTSPSAGRVLELLLSPGGLVARGARLATLEPLDAEVEAVVYVPAVQGQRIREGMAVRVSPSTVPVEEYGSIVGRVKRVADFPATPEGLERTLRNELLARALAGASPPIEVVVDLEEDDSTASGFRWSSSAGPPTEVFTGTLCGAEVAVARRRPAEYVIPGLRGLLGSAVITGMPAGLTTGLGSSRPSREEPATSPSDR